MGMHQPGWRAKNQERAWETWAETVRGQLEEIRRACDRIQVNADAHRALAEPIIDATEEIDAASEALFKLRDGPENPDEL